MDQTTHKQDKEPLTCSICQNPIPAKFGWAGGNNAQPINDGRCCDECDTRYVIPERIRQIMKAGGRL